MVEARRSERRSTHWLTMTNKQHQDSAVISRGVLRSGEQRIEYYTTQPSPAQWIAIGVMPLLPSADDAESTHRLLVGNGQSEAAAIEALRARVNQVQGTEPVDALVPPRVAHQPSDWFGD